MDIAQPKALSKLSWLKRTNGHDFTGTELRVLLSIYNHSDAHGRRSHPGIELMAKETGYKTTGISQAVTALKARGWIHEVYRGNGRARQSSVFELVSDAPNPGYRCLIEAVQPCSTCSKGSAVAEVLEPNGSATTVNGSAVPVTILPLYRSPSDPVTDPELTDLVGGPKDRPSDHGEFRHPPKHLEFQSLSPAAQLLIEGGKDMEPNGSPEAADSTAAETEAGKDERLRELVDEFRRNNPSFGSDHRVILWPAEKPLPEDHRYHPGDPFRSETYLDDETGEELPVTT